jgi:hypothetical protein
LLLNRNVPPQSKSTSDQQIFWRRRLQTVEKIFNFTGPASPFGPTISSFRPRNLAAGDPALKRFYAP